MTPPDHPIDPGTLRRVLGHVLTGVSVVTAHSREHLVGMSCNSVTAVSLKPPLVLFCAASDGRTWPVIRRSGGFCINVLAEHQRDVCLRFAQHAVDRFASLAWSHRAYGPGLDGALAWIDCTIEAEHPAGDHRIVVGRVCDAQTRSDLDPLAFFRGEYGTFARTRAARPRPRTEELAS